MRRALQSVVVAAVVMSPSLCAQERAVTVTGTVRAAGGARLPGAVVHLEDADTTVLTDAGGRFAFEGVPEGSHTLSVVADGYAPRRMGFAVGRGVAEVVDVGEVELETSDAPTVILRGTVRDAQSGQPLAGAPIRVDGEVAGMTRADGSYRIVTSSGVGKTGRLEIRRIGYAPVSRELTLPQGSRAIDLDVEMEPMPVRLEDVRVEGEETEVLTGRLGAFNRRRAQGLGTFFTRAQIRAMGATTVSDVVRRVPGATVITEDNVDVDITAGGRTVFGDKAMTSITFQRRGYDRQHSIRPCAPLVFVNDLLVRNPDIDMISRARDLAGMEVYTSAAQVPAEYNKLGSACGVIALWTDSPSRSGGVALAFEIGALFSTRWERSGSSSEQIGVQMLLPLVGPVELRPAFGLIVGAGSGFEAGWQAMANVAIHPVARLEPWYLGTGVAATTTRRQLAPPESHISHVLVTGLAIPAGPIRPFLELQLFDGFQGTRQWHTALGLTVRTQRPPPPTYTVEDAR